MPLFRVSGFFSQRPWLVSLILVLLLSLWLGQGMLQAEESTTSPSQSQQIQDVPLANVVIQTFTSQATAKNLDLYGRTAPNRDATLGAEIAGRISGLLVQKGNKVNKGQPIAQIDKGDLLIRLEKAKALLNVKEKEYTAAKSLKKRGLQGEVAFSTAQAALTDAKANVENAKLMLSHTLIKAPFSGFIDDLSVEVGDFVGVGDPVATLIDLETLVIEADVSERHVSQLELDQVANIRLVTGQLINGTLRYVSRVSSPSTNTFKVEIEIPNHGQKISAGISAEVTLMLDTQLAVKVTPAMLALDEEGNLGVKTVLDSKVTFVAIQLVKAEQDGVWLTGLGDKVDIITIGQGFVRGGDMVNAVYQP